MGSNQHLRDDVLFKSPLGSPITMLERRGPNLCLHTEDNEVWRRFREWKQLLFDVPYHQGDITGPLVAVDLYFPLTAKKALLKALATWVRKKGVSFSYEGFDQTAFEGREIADGSKSSWGQ
jgi:hypothetical protein